MSAPPEPVDIIVEEPGAEPAATAPAPVTDRTATIALQAPLDVTYRATDGTSRVETVAEMQIRRPTAGDLMALGSITSDADAIRLLERCTAFGEIRFGGQAHKRLFARLDIADTMAATQVVVGFIGTPPGTGAEPLPPSRSSTASTQPK